jgi:putative polyhydroxyalkanoate system protein
MSRIHITRTHGLTLKKAKTAAEQIAAELGEEFDIAYEWDGDVLRFERSGVNGEIRVGKKTLEVEAKLGLLVSMLKGRIETEVHRYCDDTFGPEPE